jgi:hypothetical protein
MPISYIFRCLYTIIRQNNYASSLTNNETSTIKICQPITQKYLILRSFCLQSLKEARQ